MAILAEAGRRCLLAAVLLAALVIGRPTGAAEKVKAAEAYVKLSPVVVEMWDTEGLFHTISMELIAVFPKEGKVNKAIGLKIQQELQSLPYTELAKPSGVTLIKATALRIIHDDPEGETATDVLVNKLMVN